MFKKLNAKAYLVTLVFALAIILGFSTNSYAISQADADKSPEIKVNEVKTDKLDGQGSVKWYKFNITERGYFRIALGPNADANAEDINWGWKCTIYKKGDLTSEIADIDGVTKNKTSIWLPYYPDTFYIKVENDNDSVSALVPKTNFDLKVEFVKSDVWEQEINDESTNANLINPNTVYKGFMSSTDDVDWFKFSVTETGDATINFDPDPDMSNSEDISFGWNMVVYNGSKKELNTVEQIKKSASSKKLKLTKGTYYVKIYNYAGYNRITAPVEQVYNLTVNYEGYSTAIQKTTVPGVKVKAGKKKVTVKWKKISYASGYEIYRSTKPNKGFKKVKSLSAKKTKFVDKKVKSKKKYYYKVKAYVKVNGKKYYTIDPKAKKVKVK